MSKSTACKTSDFSLEGQFLSFAALEGYKLKYLRLATASGEQWVKLPKELRAQLYRTLVPGDRIQVIGYQKFDLERGTIKLKAEQVMPLQARSEHHDSLLPTIPSTLPSSIGQTVTMPRSLQLSQSEDGLRQNSPERKLHSKPQTILVCQKSDCCKRGGASLTAALQQEIHDRGLADQVVIKPTGCMKQCKAGPNLVMPDKTRHTKIRADQVPSLLDRYFAEA